MNPSTRFYTIILCLNIDCKAWTRPSKLHLSKAFVETPKTSIGSIWSFIFHQKNNRHFSLNCHLSFFINDTDFSIFVEKFYVDNYKYDISEGWIALTFPGHPHSSTTRAQLYSHLWLVQTALSRDTMTWPVPVPLRQWIALYKSNTGPIPIQSSRVITYSQGGSEKSTL